MKTMFVILGFPVRLVLAIIWTTLFCVFHAILLLFDPSAWTRGNGTHRNPSAKDTLAWELEKIGNFLAGTK